MAVQVDDFNELMCKAREGDADALQRLSEVYEKELRLVARVQLGPALRPYLDSLDLVQTVHRSIMMGLKDHKFEINTPDHLIGLALTMVRRKVARHWRRMQRQQRMSFHGQAGEEQTTNVLTDLSSGEGDPAKNAQLRDAVQHLWNHLDEVERSVMTLRMQGLTTVEVAKRLELDADVLRVRLSRLRQRLRQAGVLSEWL